MPRAPPPPPQSLNGRNVDGYSLVVRIRNNDMRGPARTRDRDGTPVRGGQGAGSREGNELTPRGHDGRFGSSGPGC